VTSEKPASVQFDGVEPSSEKTLPRAIESTAKPVGATAPSVQ
jgi:hypothetical protein